MTKSSNVYDHLEQRRFLLNEIEFFVKMAELEQRVQMSDRLPTVEEYRRRRMGTSAVAVCIAITELVGPHPFLAYYVLLTIRVDRRYTLDMELPPDLMWSPDMRKLLDATNDMLSVRKEVVSHPSPPPSIVPLRPLTNTSPPFQAQNQVDSLIPLLYLECANDAQCAINTATAYLHTAVFGFNGAAERLLAGTTDDAGLRACLVKFIDGCRYACTANLNWR